MICGIPISGDSSQLHTASIVILNSWTLCCFSSSVIVVSIVSIPCLVTTISTSIPVSVFLFTEQLRTGDSGPGDRPKYYFKIFVQNYFCRSKSPGPQHYHKAHYLSSNSLSQCYSDLDLGPEYRWGIYWICLYK